MATPDYLIDYNASLGLVRQLTHYYHSRGYKKVKVWLEPEMTANGRKMFNIRSNIVFTAPRKENY